MGTLDEIVLELRAAEHRRRETLTRVMRAAEELRAACDAALEATEDERRQHRIYVDESHRMGLRDGDSASREHGNGHPGLITWPKDYPWRT